jgi:predicted O-methyltransferase YrrM
MLYRQGMAPFGRRKVRRMLERGLSPELSHPLKSLFSESLDDAERQAVCRVEEIREGIASQAGTFAVVNRDGDVRRLSAAEIAHKVSVTREWGTFLYLCSHAVRARTILELGSCAGISGCYMATSDYCERFITIEASAALASLARAHLARISNCAEVVNGLFDDALDAVLPRLHDGLDLAYIDGHHKPEPTLRYLHRLTPHLNEGALVIFDDVHLSEGMSQAWQAIERRPGFSHTIDAGRFGVCSWDGRALAPVNHDLGLYLGWLRRVSPRRPSGLAPVDDVR